jgi:hypothetical protein
MHHPTLEIVVCPECAAPAEVVDRVVLESTDGPIERDLHRTAPLHGAGGATGEPTGRRRDHGRADPRR